METKKRGPRPGYKDRLLRRLERLESMVEGIEPHGPDALVSAGELLGAATNSGSKRPLEARFKRINALVQALDGDGRISGRMGSDEFNSMSDEEGASVNMYPMPPSRKRLSVVPESSDSQSMQQLLHRTSSETNSPQLLTATNHNAQLLTDFQTLAQASTSPTGPLQLPPVRSASNVTSSASDLMALDTISAAAAVAAAAAAAAGSQPVGIREPSLAAEIAAAAAAAAAAANNIIVPPHSLSWTQPPIVTQSHALLNQLHSAAAPVGADLNFYLADPTSLFSSLAYPSLLDPFPSIFPGAFGSTQSLSNLPLFDSSPARQHAQQNLEAHLVMMGITYNQVIPLSTRHALDILPPNRRVSSLPQALHDALVAYGAFFSGHPDLFTPLLDKTLTVLPQTHAEKNEARIRIARMYIMRARKALNASVVPAGSTHVNEVNPDSQQTNEDGTPIETLDECDAVRVMLILATIYFGLGDGGDSMQLVADAYRLAQKAKIYESSLLANPPSQAPPLTVDTLVISVPRVIPGKPITEKLSIDEKFDRRVLWGSCLILDTYCAMASGYQSGIDEGDYPDLVATYSFADLLNRINVSSSSSSGRVMVPTLGKNTLWESTPFSVMFDDVAESSFSTLVVSPTTGEFESQLHLTFIMRRVLRYTRSHPAPLGAPLGSKTSLSRFPEDLPWYANVPSRFRAFSSLEALSENGPSEPSLEYNQWPFNSYIVESILTFLSAFSYLHLPLISSPDASTRKYRLSHDADKTSGAHWTSRQVLLVCFRALSQMIERLYTPTVPLQSPFKPYTYDEEQLRVCQSQSLPSETPSPSLCWTVHSLNIYIISSAGLLAMRAPDPGCAHSNDEFEFIVGRLNSFVLPSLERIGKVWPMAQLYQYKLVMLLKGGTASDWAAEAQSYVQS
eukprot:jgi/Hompol1/3748/HPOL_003343-RA